MRNLNDRMKLAEVDAERSQYEDTVTMAELRRMTVENNRKNGRNEFTLEEINQYINEVRSGRKE